jgi:hypothetical protein
MLVEIALEVGLHGRDYPAIESSSNGSWATDPTFVSITRPNECFLALLLVNLGLIWVSDGWPVAGLCEVAWLRAKNDRQRGFVRDAEGRGGRMSSTAKLDDCPRLS